MNARALIRCMQEVAPIDLSVIAYRYWRHSFSALRRDLLGPWVPTTAVLELTYDCTRHCKHCYTTPRHNSSHMSPAMVRQIVEHMAAHGGIHLIAFLGGEPLTAPNVPVISSVAEDHPTLLFSIATNGDFLALCGLPPRLEALPNIIYYLSIDGLTEKTNDSLRGERAFANVTTAFAFLLRAKKFFCASVTVRGSNFDEVTSRAFLRFLSDHGVKLAFFMRERGKSELSHEDFERAVHLVRKNARGQTLHVRFGSMEDRVALSGHTRLIFNPSGRARLSKVDLDQQLPIELDAHPWVRALRHPPWESAAP